MRIAMEKVWTCWKLSRVESGIIFNWTLQMAAKIRLKFSSECVGVGGSPFYAAMR
jgi:hypothetical protein